MRAGCDKAALLLERLYGRILAVYPAEFRHQYAAEMVAFFGEDCRRAARRHGLAGLLAQGRGRCGMWRGRRRRYIWT